MDLPLNDTTRHDAPLCNRTEQDRHHSKTLPSQWPFPSVEDDCTGIYVSFTLPFGDRRSWQDLQKHQTAALLHIAPHLQHGSVWAVAPTMYGFDGIRTAGARCVVEAVAQLRVSVHSCTPGRHHAATSTHIMQTEDRTGLLAAICLASRLKLKDVTLGHDRLNCSSSAARLLDAEPDRQSCAGG